MADIVHYEVYVFQRNKWDLLARYPEAQRLDAIDYAKKIEKDDGIQTKVIREKYDLETKTFQETLVFLGEMKAQSHRNYHLRTNLKIPELPRSKQGNGGSSIVEALTMLLLSLLFAVIISGISTATILHAAFSFGWIAHTLPQQSVLTIFVFFFLLIAIPTAAKWVDWNVFLQDSASDGKQETDDDGRSDDYHFTNQEIYGSDPISENTSPSFLSYLMQKVFDFFDLLTGQEPLSARQQKEEEKTDDHSETSEDGQPPSEDEKKEEEEDKSENDKNTSVQNLKSDEIELPPALDKDYLEITSFLTVILRALKNNNTQLNTYTRFGLELFLAGACEALCQNQNLNKDQNRVILTKLLTVLGRTASLADVFYNKLDEYMLEPKYLPMIEHGSECMRLFLNNPTSPDLLTQAQSYMEAWKNPDQKEQISSGIVTVMFTDMVSSTHLTQTLGDKFAQQIVRVHNSIVRKALKRNGGTEIKHTGDGIMASFVWASNAVDAAVEIQQAVAQRNNEEPTVPLEIRIGLNSGEPIVEDNDLFGSTVQMASRICGQAGANQIYVSSVVKELYAGKKHTFKSLGEFELKGIDEPQPLYEVIWKKPSFKAQPAPVSEKEEGVVDLSATLPEF